MNTNSHKDKYVAEAINILKQGDFRLSLDKMADEMGITEKTLYDNFSSKDELLKECMHAISGGFQGVLSTLEKSASSPIEGLTKCFAQLGELFVTLNPVFFSDMVRGDPDQTTLEHLMGSRYFGKMMATNLQRGVQRGLYRSDLDVPFVCECISYSIFGFCVQAVIHNQPLPMDGYFASILQYHLRAIVSAEGNHSIQYNHDKI